ncbi:hypothetical protein [Sporomusa carbonis]|uniref:hypothetical protein n=1 Tax=Sporomusa carbonis TaxID=3076075 RepID=UPI003C7C5825
MLVSGESLSGEHLARVAGGNVDPLPTMALLIFGTNSAAPGQNFDNLKFVLALMFMYGTEDGM